MKKRSKVWWHPLDNAAKIFPVTSNRTDTKVFRFSCQLKNDVREDILSEATDVTLEDFPLFQSVIKRGLFWYYLEKSTIKPVVREEYRQPCSPLFDRNVKRLLFEVTYYKKRINIEIHHSLTDGTGAVQFLRMLVMNYLKLACPELENTDLSGDDDASDYEKSVDSFDWYYDKQETLKTPGGKLPKKVFRFKGHRLAGFKMKIIEGIMPAGEVLSFCREKETTVTVLFTSMMLKAACKSMSVKQKKRPVVIKVPVNLRAFFPSSTARNFFSVMQIDYNFSTQSEALEDIISYVDACFKSELTEERLLRRMRKMGRLEKNFVMRSVPLSLKDIFMKLAYDITNRKYTMSLSNIGVIKLPEVLTPYIDRFDVFVSSDTYKACMCSYNGKLSIGFSSPYEETELQKQFFRQLSAAGISAAVLSNEEVEA